VSPTPDGLSDRRVLEDPRVATVQFSGIRVIALDLDDTLISETEYAFSGFEAVGEWLRERKNCAFDPAARMKELFVTGNRRTIFDQVLSELGTHELAGDIPGLVAQMVACYRGHRPRVSLLADARRAITRWAGAFFLALISDGPLIMQRQKVTAVEIERQFDLVILTDEWGRQYWKPHPRAFEAVEQASGQAGPACIYIADNPQKDFIAPRARGWRTVRICRTDGVYASMSAPAEHQAEHQITTFDDVDIRS
jgi:putative hydrolase of the HAD superfamily